MPHSLPEPGEGAGRPVLRLVVPNELAAIDGARLQMLAFLGARATLSAKTIYRLELVLEESLMNRVMHAFPGGGRHEVALTISLAPAEPVDGAPEDVVLRFEDDGVAFDPLAAESPTPGRADPSATGGFGNLLTRRAARALFYERVAGRNRVTVRVAAERVD